jgi:hypothetical protein
MYPGGGSLSAARDTPGVSSAANKTRAMGCRTVLRAFMGDDGEFGVGQYVPD